MKKKKSISELTLKTITNKQIKPIPKWEFLAKNWTLWAGILASLIVLIIGLGLVIFGVIDNIISPYFWLIVAVIFFGVSYVLFQKTKRAYIFAKWQVVVTMVLLGLIIGGILFKSGLARRIDKSMETNIPRYRQMAPMKIATWTNPEAGYLSGEIVEINENNFEIKDFAGKAWIIVGKPLVKGRVQMQVGEEIKIVGSQEDENTFEATEVRPWTGRGQNMMKEN